MTPVDEHTLDRLQARQEIRDALMAYARGVDRRDSALIRSAYHPDAVDDHGFFKALGWELADIADTDAAVATSHSITHHLMLNEYVQLHGDTAESETYFAVHHRFEHDGIEYDMVMRGRYVDRWDRRDGGPFKIAARRLIFDWIHTDPLGGRWPGPDTDVPKWVWGGEDVISTEGVTWGLPTKDDPSYETLVGSLSYVAVLDCLERVLARLEMDDALMGYARGVDRHDVELIRSAFHPDTVADFGFFRMNAWEAAAMAAPESDAPVKTAWDVTQHLLLNRYVQVQGDVAQSETYFCAVYRFGHGGTDYDMFLRGRYLARWERRSGGPFKIADRTEIWDTVRTDVVAGVWPGPDPAVPKWAWGDDNAVSIDGVSWGVVGLADPSFGLLEPAGGKRHS